MSFYRTILTAVAAIAIAAPVFADDTSDNMQGTTNQSVQTTTESTTATETTNKVNLNTAAAKDLMKVKGVNAPKARAIIAYRKKHGNFKSTDDLANVKGFKKMNADTLKSIEDQLIVE
jgi:competence protein ComEA